MKCFYPQYEEDPEDSLKTVLKGYVTRLLVERQFCAVCKSWEHILLKCKTKFIRGLNH